MPQYLMMTNCASPALPVVVNANTYSGLYGQFIAAPMADVVALENLGWTPATGVLAAGTTAQRPTGLSDGSRFFDTTLGAMVTWDANPTDGRQSLDTRYPIGAWRNAAGQIV